MFFDSKISIPFLPPPKFVGFRALTLYAPEGATYARVKSKYQSQSAPIVRKSLYGLY